MKKNIIILFISVLYINLAAQNKKLPEISDATRFKISSILTSKANEDVKVNSVKIDSIETVGKTMKIFAGVNLSYIPFRKEDVIEIYAKIKEKLPTEYKTCDIQLITDNRKIEDLVLFSRSKKDLFRNKLSKPLVTNISKPYTPSNGLFSHHLAVWQSHGWYYEQKLSRWEWQRARIFQTVEDLYTQSYVLPYLVPMLENAGANVLLPRERDIQRNEIIVDNDNDDEKSVYKEISTKEIWSRGSSVGFANKKDSYIDGENPFRMGTYSQVKTIIKGEESTCEWIPHIPENGKYGIYISYKTLPTSADDALYTVYHKGGKTEFKINQKMGGGTWVFLGFFLFEKGTNEDYKIVLSNKSLKAGSIVTADAVKIGGGMGNIARLPYAGGEVTENTKSSEAIDDAKKVKSSKLKIDYKPQVSNYPRYTEGARYWLQWAGAPDSIYNRSKSKNDYTDDYQSRGLWVNYMTGGSSVLPNKKGLGIPIDLAFAFHSDAGTTPNDSIIGTLGICMTHINNEKFENGLSRWASRDLTHIVMDEIVKDIRSDYEPEWTRRQIWNRSYSEARKPNVPTMLLELLSHQNFADMRYGLDPRFRFSVSRSIYKGMLKFVAHEYGFEYVVQPLPVKSFSTEFSGDLEVELTWLPTEDKAEPTAKPERYIIYTRIDDGGFDNGQIVNTTSTKLNIKKDKIYSFRVAALNKGGESFPSEILSVCRKSNEKGVVLVVNGFERLSAPHSFESDGIAGFLDAADHGVPDGPEYNYIGSQKEFKRAIPWTDDDASGFGDSYANFETTVIAGNTFDYPFVHGTSIANAGYSFTSSSSKSIANGQLSMSRYPFVDFILGKQKQVKIGREVNPAQFKTFPKDLQTKITDYCKKGGHIFVSGAYVASDLWSGKTPLKEDIEFAKNILKFTWRVDKAVITGKVKSVASPFSDFDGKYEYYSQLNSVSYAAEDTDALEPEGENTFTIFRYSENNLSAGIASVAENKTCVLGFPFEAIKSKKERDDLMAKILSFIFTKNK